MTRTERHRRAVTACLHFARPQSPGSSTAHGTAGPQKPRSEHPNHTDVVRSARVPDRYTKRPRAAFAALTRGLADRRRVD